MFTSLLLFFIFAFKSKYKGKTITLRKKYPNHHKKIGGCLVFYKHFPAALEKIYLPSGKTSEVKPFQPSSPRMRLATAVGDDALADWQEAES